MLFCRLVKSLNSDERCLIICQSFIELRNKTKSNYLLTAFCYQQIISEMRNENKTN